MRKSVRFTQVLPWFLLCISLLLSLFIYAKYGQNTLDSDQSSEFVLADLLNHEKAFISRNWYYSTELRTVSPVPIYQLGLLLFHSWHNARLFSIAFLMIASAAAFLFAARCTGYIKEAPYCAACFILPFSYVHSFLFSWGCFYCMYFILGCILFGLVASLNQSHYRVIKFILIVCLSLWAGTAGIRMFMIIGIPLLVSYLMIWLNAGHSRNEFRLQLAGSLLCFVCIGVGYLINARVLSSIYHFRQYGDLVTSSFSIIELLNRFDALLGYFSYESGVPFLSFSGGISLLTVLMVFAIFLFPALLLINSTVPLKERVVPVFSLTGILAVWIIDCMSAGYEAASTSVGYYIMGLIFAILCLFIFIDRSHLPMRPFFLVALCLLFYGNTLTFVRHHVPSHEKQQAKAVTWLNENGYSQGFATFWNGNLLTELSDGSLDVIIYDTWRSREPYEWLQAISHTRDLPEGPVFLYTDTEEMTLDPSPCLDDNYLSYQEDSIRIYIYPDAQYIHSTQLNQYLNSKGGN